MTNANRKRSFKVDARALLSLGRESIKDHTTALVELVKNSYDADAENVDIEIFADGRKGVVRISDDGIGMTSSDINNKWLRIGFSEKRKKKISSKGRRETGEKGIGRLSADRLGAILELRSVTASGLAVGIGVDWDKFDVDGAEVGSVPIADLPIGKPLLPQHGVKPSSGTEINIRQLRQEWSAEDFVSLETELSSLVPAGSVTDFSVWLRTNPKEKFKKLGSAFEGAAELDFRGGFDAKGRLSYRVTEKPDGAGKARKVVDKGVINFNQLVPGKLDYKIGPVRIELSYFLRAAVDLGDFTLGQLREYLNVYGGVRVYRDNVRVKPYGNPSHPEGDWLGLADRKVRNPAGAGRSDYRISANQLVGAVYIGRDTNPSLSDSAAREGLVHGEAFASLKGAVFGCVALLESIYHRRFVQRRQDAISPVMLPTVVGEIKARIEEIRENLSKVSDGGSPRTITRLLRDSVEKVEALAAQVNVAEREIEELASQATVYRGLATVGISSAVFGHETESALVLAKACAGLALDAINQDEPDVAECQEELSKAVRAIDKVAVWGQFALARVKKDKRRRTKLDVSRLISRLVRETRPLFSASTIALEQDIQPDLETRGFAMDFEALLLNLLTNAYHAAGSVKRNRRVTVSARLRGRGAKQSIFLIVSDSGAGIARQHLDRIWTPLFSTRVDQSGKPAGTGLGLTIVKSIATDLGATIEVEPKGPLGGASFTISIPVRG